MSLQPEGSIIRQLSAIAALCVCCNASDDYNGVKSEGSQQYSGIGREMGPEKSERPASEWGALLRQRLVIRTLWRRRPRGGRESVFGHMGRHE